ncbi:MAG: site-specific DNA-methyltransferase [Burkholderiales bacterium]|nr:site-specific DNA-methyltransferase [Burkholderiales bacterium]MCL4690053.1 site-specific DNA-methyltransferase [Burkholderiales bacterium]
MPEIVFKGKEYVYNHHLAVPYRPLVAHADKSVGAPDLSGNLVVHGDNLAALKALLPRYAGKVDLVFIDPPYNTGNERWAYNDNVNSPIMREWLSSNPVDGEDLLRHDKWLCMMWPRLVLLRELLSESGSIWITLDDNEVHRARMVLDEVFGDSNHVATVIWEKADSPKMDAETFSTRHDTMLVYAHSLEQMTLRRLAGDEDDIAPHYDKTDEDGRAYYLKPLRAMGGQGETRAARPNLYFALTAPDGTEVFPKLRDGTDGAWRWSSKKCEAERSRIEWRRSDSGGWAPYFRIYADTSKGIPPETIFYNTDVGSSRSAAAELKSLMGSNVGFATPKPTQLLQRILAIGAHTDSLILDSFAGSGTTAHAVMKANAADNGNRRFILVECEDYADSLTAERVRRAINGYAWQGTQRETLLERKITFTQLKKADKLLAEIETIKVREGLAEGDLADRGAQAKPPRFDSIEAKVDDGVLRVEGVRRVSERAPGLGGNFTFCTLGEEVDLAKMLSGERLPTAEALGAWLFHTATGGTLQAAPKGAPAWYLSESADRHVWLIYRPDLPFLKSPEAALTLSRAREMAEWGRRFDAERGRSERPKGHLVFAPAKYMSNKQLGEHGIAFAPLPYALYREA